MSLTRSRRVARQVLVDVRTRDAWGHEIMAARLGDADLSEPDTAFATRLAYGTLATVGTLDGALDRHITRPARIHPLVRDALRLAAYEILFMRTPDRVAVHQGVENVKEVAPAAKGLANAVLRRLADEAEGFPWGDPQTDLSAHARLTGTPQWLAELLVADHGELRARAMMEAALEPAPLYLAHNPFRTAFPELIAALEHEGVRPSVCEPEGCILAGNPAAAVRSSALADGECIVMDAAAQFIAGLAVPPQGGVAIDLAAGRGSKTLLIRAGALRRGIEARVVAADIHPFKLELLASRLSLLGVPEVEHLVADSTREDAVELLGGEGCADSVLVDAPCSGLGTLRRHPEKRWRLSPAVIEETALIAEALLRTAARLVRPGGFVVYSTCTVTKRENDQVVDGFLASREGVSFMTESLERALPTAWRSFLTSEGWFASLPATGGPDGHFAAVLRRR